MNVIKDLDGRYIICVLNINDRHIVLTNLYGPNSDSPHFYELVFDQLQQLNNPEWIMTGDFNLVLDNILDNKTQDRLHANGRVAAFLVHAMDQYDLVDIW